MRRLLPCISMLSHPASYPPHKRGYQGTHVSMCCNAVPDNEVTASTTSGVIIKWTQESKDQLLALRNEGKSPKEAPEVMGRSELAIFQAWQRLYSKDLGPWVSRVWIKDRKDQLLALRNEGKSQKEAAEVIGCTPSVVNIAWYRFFRKEYGSWKGGMDGQAD